MDISPPLVSSVLAVVSMDFSSTHYHYVLNQINDCSRSSDVFSCFICCSFDLESDTCYHELGKSIPMYPELTFVALSTHSSGCSRSALLFN